MSVWLTIPSKRPPEQAEPVLKLWRERGYKLALFIDWNPPGCPLQTHYSKADLLLCGGGQFEPQFDETESNGPLGLQSPLGKERRRYYPHFDKYPGYAQACNALIVEILERDPQAEWFVCAGDDTEPDPNHSAEEIAIQCSEHFAPCNVSWNGMEATFGVMQPTGDRWGEDRKSHAFDPVTPGCDSCRCRQCGQGPDAPRHMVGAYIDRVCGSPWIGREFARRMYRGNGPYHPEYTHMGVDEELQAVAIKMGVLWQRQDLTHFHRHWGRGPGQYGDAAKMPDFLKKANTAAEWDRYKGIFSARKILGFPGHEPLA